MPNKNYAGYIPFELQADYHVWGLEWNKDVIRFYLDGVLYREAENTHWHQPLAINLNCESNKWLNALPDDSRLTGNTALNTSVPGNRRDSVCCMLPAEEISR